MHILKKMTAFMLISVSGSLTSEAADVGYYRNPNNVDVTVTLDFAEVVKIAQPAATVVVGNSGMLDVNVSDPRMLILTGKAPGITNVVLFNQQGERLKEYLVEIQQSRRKMTTVHQGNRIETYQCGKDCTPVLSIGDNPEHFDKTKSQVKSRSTFSENSSDGTETSSQSKTGASSIAVPDISQIGQ